MKKIYAISMLFNKAEITTHCWGDQCGKGNASAFIIENAPFITCNSDECPIADGDTLHYKDEQLGNAWRSIHIRKLQRPPSPRTHTPPEVNP